MSMSYALHELQQQTGLPSVAYRNAFSARTDDVAFQDRVTAIDLRVLIGDLFRSLYLQPTANAAAFRMELECTWIAWFPQRLQRILETMVSNSILSCSQHSGESRVSVYFRRLYPGYELRVTDNTKKVIFPAVEKTQTDSIARRVCGLQVARTLLEESDGELVIHGDNGHGTMSIAKLPVYCMGDFLEGSLSIESPFQNPVGGAKSS